MSLGLYHHEVVSPETRCPSCEVVNVQDFPEEFKAKFADFLFDFDVMVIDWAQTIESIVGLHYDSFLAIYELVLNADGKYFFAQRGCENPLSSELLITVNEDGLKYIKRTDPHIMVRRLGYQRKGMKDSFFANFSRDQVIIDDKIVHKMMTFCDSADSMENFSDGFVDNWTDTSFVMVQY